MIVFLCLVGCMLAAFVLEARRAPDDMALFLDACRRNPPARVAFALVVMACASPIFLGLELGILGLQWAQHVLERVRARFTKIDAEFDDE